MLFSFKMAMVDLSRAREMLCCTQLPQYQVLNQAVLVPAGFEANKEQTPRQFYPFISKRLHEGPILLRKGWTRES